MQTNNQIAKLAILGVVGVAAAGILTRTVKGIVSFVQNLLPSLRAKVVRLLLSLPAHHALELWGKNVQFWGLTERGRSGKLLLDG